MEGDGDSENKENVSRKRLLSETNSTAEATGSGGDGHPATKKVKVVDILLGSSETDLVNVKKEPFVDGMYCLCVRVFVCVCACVRVCVCVRVRACVCV